MERACEGSARVHLRVAEPRQPAQHHVDLELAALGPGPDRFVAEERVEHSGCGVHEDVAGGHRVLTALVVGPDHLGTVRTRVHGADRCPRQEFCTAGAGSVGERVDDRTHPTDGHIPVSRPAADHVVEETAVLHERCVLSIGEGADQRIGHDDAPHEVAGEGSLDELTQRRVEVGPPLFADGGPRVGSRRQGLGDAREHGLRQGVRPCAESLPRRVVRRGADGGERASGRAVVPGVDEQASRRVAGQGSVGSDPAAPQFERQPQLVADRPRHQRDEIGVAGQVGVNAAEDARRTGGTAEVVGPFQHQDAASGPREVGRSGQPVVAAADDHRVIPALCHGATLAT